MHVYHPIGMSDQSVCIRGNQGGRSGRRRGQSRRSRTGRAEEHGMREREVESSSPFQANVRRACDRSRSDIVNERECGCGRLACAGGGGGGVGGRGGEIRE